MDHAGVRVYSSRKSGLSIIPQQHAMSGKSFPELFPSLKAGPCLKVRDAFAGTYMGWLRGYAPLEAGKFYIFETGLVEFGEVRIFSPIPM